MDPTAEALLMEHMTVEDMRQALAGTQTVLVPLGVTEQHGYHLPLSTDVHNACQIARRVSQRTGAVVAPPLWYSYSGGELPGTINVAPQVMALMVAEIVGSRVVQGFRNVVLVLGHGGAERVEALKDLVSGLLGRFPHVPDLAIAFAPAWEFSPTWLQGHREHDFHAGRIETSLMLHWAPELVRTDRVVEDEPPVAESLREHPDNYQDVRRIVDDPHVAPRIAQRADIKVGVMGYPHQASAELGQQVCEECVVGITALVKKMETAKAEPSDA